MFVCHCMALNDAAIAELARTHSPTFDAVAAACGAGTKCGGCQPLIEEVLERAAADMHLHVSSAS